MTTKPDRAVVFFITAEIENTDANFQMIVTEFRKVMKFAPTAAMKLDDGSGLIAMTVGPAYGIPNMGMATKALIMRMRLNVTLYDGGTENTLPELHARIAMRKAERLAKRR